MHMQDSRLASPSGLSSSPPPRHGKLLDPQLGIPSQTLMPSGVALPCISTCLQLSGPIASGFAPHPHAMRLNATQASVPSRIRQQPAGQSSLEGLECTSTTCIFAVLSLSVLACTSSALDEILCCAEGVSRLHRIELASPLLLAGDVGGSCWPAHSSASLVQHQFAIIETCHAHS